MKKLMLWALLLTLAAPAHAVEPVPTGSFQFSFAVEIPATPNEVFDAATGDISAWWDHSMSEHPVELIIEPTPGGRFLEIMDSRGGGVVHARVTQVQYGKMLRLVGPLGLAGHAINMVTTWTLEPAGDQATKFTVEVHATGEMHEGWGEAVEETWRHFIEGRLLPYLEK